ncbi:MAG: hypothetical protein P0Y56_14520 [Candidatus Andeanibacterium colombiense]|uniref:Uncharacterized protein n=1 Tax=Candidatus Andeanibacterium colombiense TaxID=3121345 RepID=A0AAJ5X4D1_9SPHN|nr:MAG: hypothetical protein P0Y56_14520 [Sphingomonadaceae bacterium]
MRLFRILFTFDLMALLVLAYFFADGLRYATGGSNYFGAWLPLLGVPAAVLALAWWLKERGSAGAAKLLLGLLAAPFVLYLLFAGLFIALDPDMK